MQRALVKFVLGLAVAVPLWWFTLPAYARLVVLFGAPLVHTDSQFATATFAVSGSRIAMRNPPLDMPAEQMTYNLVLLIALFASVRRPFRDRNVVAFLTSLAIVFTTHVVGLLLWIESAFAIQRGGWSTWSAVQTLLQIIGMPAIVFACWWAATSGILFPDHRSGG